MVHLASKTTDPGNPEIVGIPILQQLPPLSRLGKLLGKLKRVIESLATEGPTPFPLLHLHFLHSFAWGDVDFVISGVLIIESFA